MSEAGNEDQFSRAKSEVPLCLLSKQLPSLPSI